MKKSLLTILGVSAVGMLLLAGCGTQTETVATFHQGNQVEHVTMSALQTEINLQTLWNPTVKISSTQRKQILNQYIIYDNLLLSKAQKVGIKSNPILIRQLASSYEKGATQAYYDNSQQKFDQALVKLNLTNADIYQYASDQYILHQYAQLKTGNASLPQQKAYYNKNKAQFTIVTWRDLVVGTLQQATVLKTKLAHHIAWSVLAKKYSTDANSKFNGGLYKEVVTTQFIQPIQYKLLSLPINKISAPFETPFGFYIVQVLSRKTTPFTQVQSTISAILKQQTVNTVLGHTINQLAQQAQIKVGE